jgi:gas vesicle protein
MKKFILSSLLFLLIGSYGGAIVGTAQAQTAAPAAASGEARSLDALRAQLLQLQAQAAAESSSPAITGVTTGNVSVSNQNLAQVSASLQALTSSLAQLSQTIAANPSLLTDNTRTVLRSVLTSVSDGLVAVNQTLAASAPVAVTSPVNSAPLARSNGATVSDQSAATPALKTTGAVTAQNIPAPSQSQAQIQPQPTLAVNNNSNPAIGTAQASNSVPVSRGWMVTFGIIALILVIFFIWRYRSGRKGIRALAYQANTATSVSSNVSVSTPAGQKPIEMGTGKSYGGSSSSSSSGPVIPPTFGSS